MCLVHFLMFLSTGSSLFQIGVRRASGRHLGLILIGSLLQPSLARKSARLFCGSPEWAFTLIKETSSCLLVTKFLMKCQIRCELIFKSLRSEVVGLMTELKV